MTPESSISEGEEGAENLEQCIFQAEPDHDDGADQEQDEDEAWDPRGSESAYASVHGLVGRLIEELPKGTHGEWMDDGRWKGGLVMLRWGMVTLADRLAVS